MQQFFDFTTAPRCTFENFVPCDGNAAALCFARRIADGNDPEKLLFIHGPSGSGKTHLLAAISRECTPHTPLLSCREPVSRGAIAGRFTGQSALLVDDIHHFSGDESLKIELWQIFNEFHTAGRPIAITGLHPPKELTNLDEHFISRLLWGLVARVDASDDESRRMILRKLAADRQIRVPDEVFAFLVATTDREVGALIGAFETLYRFSMEGKRRITLPLAREAMHQNSTLHQTPTGGSDR